MKYITRNHKCRYISKNYEFILLLLIYQIYSARYIFQEITKIHTHFEVGACRSKTVHEFRYLGSIVTRKNKENTEIKTRLQGGNKCYEGLSKLLKVRMTSRNLKV